MTRTREDLSDEMRRAVLDRGSMPKYLQIASALRRRIRAGVYPPSHPLPNVDRLCAEFGVARMTVFKALDDLKAEALIRSEAGRGVFVCAPFGEEQIALDDAIESEHPSEGGRQSRLIACREMTGPLPEPFEKETCDEPYLYLKRIMMVGETAYHLGHYYIPMDVARAHDAQTWREMTVARILTTSGVFAPVRVRQTIQLDTADFDVAADLDIRLNEPVFQVTRRFVTVGTGRLLAFAHLVFRADMVRFETTLDLNTIDDLNAVRGHILPPD
ncbi:MAG: GntR family transcriptional regulator [Tropicimonas sp.]|uniref:GntR family transcriptional regulator n=1 Tax=Tropicimonas sp. TaxID=2067044 RepID=UPI003A87BAD3